MKAITIFSGKGGVGKSTISALLGLALSKKHKVVILDMDVNTPSMPVLFGNREKIGNLTILSTGFDSKEAITFKGVTVRKYLRRMLKKVLELKPDICIMDLPPGFSDIHLSACIDLKPSSFVLIIQPNRLSKDDAMRASAVFRKTQIPIAGIIENMEGDVFGGKQSINIFNLPILATIPLNAELGVAGSAGVIDTVENPLADVAEKLFKKATTVSWEMKPLSKDFLGESEDRVAELFFNPEDKGTWRYRGLNSWDYVRKKLLELTTIMTPDMTLLMNDTETIKRMLDGLDENMEGLFMILRAPGTEDVLFPGEIGHGSLIDNKPAESYYGLPRIGYQTDKGVVHLFPHEVAPRTIDDLLQLEKEGEIVLAPNSNAQRYVPSAKALVEIDEMYGRMVHVPPNWESEYERLGVTVDF